MKIGILTLPLHTNYGGILQAYALQEILKRKGHETVQLNGTESFSLPALKAPLAYTKRFILKYFLCKRIDIFVEKTKYKELMIVGKHTQEFIDRYITYSNVSLNKLPKNFTDAIVVGSDQIWRPSYNTYVSDAFLEFAKGWDIKRVSYAPSFGRGDWEFTPAETRKCAKLLQSFDGISVREKSATSLCREHFEVEAKFVLDPTLLLSSSDYLKLIENIPSAESKGDLMVYVLDYDKDKHEAIEFLCDKFNYKSFRTGSDVENNDADIESRMQPPVEEWLQGFYESKFVVTDSFHAAVFSIIFNKPFIVYGNKFRGLDRFISLLSVVGLEDRLILNSEGIKTATPKEINWENVNEKLKLVQKESIEFLEKYF